MERTCLSSSAEGLHRQITTAFRVRFSGSSCIFSLSALCFCHRAKLRLASPCSLFPVSFYTSQHELISGMHLLSRPRIANWGARNRFQVFASLDNNYLVEGSCGSSGRLGGGDSSASEALTEERLVVDDQSVLDRGRGPLALQEILHEIHEEEIEDALVATNNFQSHGNMTWFQAHFIKIVGPIVRVLNGTYLNKALARTEKYAWQDDETSWSLMRLLNGSLPPEYHRRKIGKRLRQIEADFFLLTSHIGRFVLIMMATGAILATGFQLAGGNSELETLIWYSWLAGVISGSMIGAEKVMEKRVRSGPRNVIITGSTRGLGKALAREFLISGDRVVIASRSPESVAETVEELQKEIESKLCHSSLMKRMGEGESPSIRAHDESRVIGMACDVSKVADVRALAEFTAAKFGSIDIWVNNAGVSKGFRPLVQFSDDDIRQIVSANLIGSLICTREAVRVMKSQPKGGHVFNMDGAGSGGSSTPLTAVYGATKCGLRQLHTSILKECKRSRVGVHTASPGMVLTDLLLSGASLQNKKMFNIICELPETVARSLVPRMREIRGTGKAINFLTPPRILLALITAWLRRGRWFDDEGRAVYAAEADRVRNWAEGRTRFPVSAAMDQFSESTLISVFSITVICAFIILSTAESGLPGT